MEKDNYQMYCQNQGTCNLVEDKDEKPITKKHSRLEGGTSYSCKYGLCTMTEQLNKI